MAKFDTEQFLNSVRDVLQANLPTKLDAIDTEKSDGITLDDIPNASYYLNEFPRSANTSLFLVYGADAITPLSAGTIASKEYSVFIIIGHSGQKNVPLDTTNRKLLRYSRAVQEVMSERFDEIASGHSKITISEFPANPEIQLQNGETITVSGLAIAATIAG